MDDFNSYVAVYQERIGAYDRQLWEKWVEQSVLKGLHNMPNKIGHVKPELIDVDLVRGSTFSRAKPQHGWCKVTLSGVIHILFMPFYFTWWCEHTSRSMAMLLVILYGLQSFTMVLYGGDNLTTSNVTSLSMSHLSLPLILMFILGVIHAHMMSSSEMIRHRKKRDDRSRCSLSVERSSTTLVSGSTDTTLTTAPPVANVNGKYKITSAAPTADSETTHCTAPVTCAGKAEPLVTQSSEINVATPTSVQLIASATGVCEEGLRRRTFTDKTRSKVSSPVVASTLLSRQPTTATCPATRPTTTCPRYTKIIPATAANGVDTASCNVASSFQGNGRAPNAASISRPTSEATVGRSGNSITLKENSSASCAKKSNRNTIPYDLGIDTTPIPCSIPTVSNISIPPASSTTNGILMDNEQLILTPTNDLVTPITPISSSLVSCPEQIDIHSHLGTTSISDNLPNPISVATVPFTPITPNKPVEFISTYRIEHKYDSQNTYTAILKSSLSSTDRSTPETKSSTPMTSSKTITNAATDSNLKSTTTSSPRCNILQTTSTKLGSIASVPFIRVPVTTNVCTTAPPTTTFTTPSHTTPRISSALLSLDKPHNELVTVRSGAQLCQQCYDPLNAVTSQPTLCTLVGSSTYVESISSSVKASLNNATIESDLSDPGDFQSTRTTINSSEEYHVKPRSLSFGSRSQNYPRRKVCKTAGQRTHETNSSRRYCNSCSQEVTSRPLYDEETQNSHVTSREATADSSDSDVNNTDGHCSSSHTTKAGAVSNGVSSCTAKRPLLLVPPPVATATSSSRVSIGNSDWDESVQSEVACGSSDSSSEEEVNTTTISSVVTAVSPSTNNEHMNSADCHSSKMVRDVKSHSFLVSNSLHKENDIQQTSSLIKNLSSCNDRISCMIWDCEAVKKLDLTILDIGWTIIDRVEKQYNTLYGERNMLSSLMVLAATVLPIMFRMYHTRAQLSQLSPYCLTSLGQATTILFGASWRHMAIICNGILQRFFLSLLFYFLLSVAERTFKQRFLYAKNFCHLTSSRRARKYELPHFRLNKVRNIKYWLSLRSFLKKQGPQRSVDAIVSFTFIITVMLVSYMCIELLRDTGTFLEHLSNWELMLWCLTLGLYELHFMTLGTKINKKYRNFSVLITEQINLYLHMEQKPHKKEELMLANNVLRLAENLLKELDSPFKISGLSANPYLYNITKVVILSAFSAVLTELLGFKLKLYKIKLR